MVQLLNVAKLIKVTKLGNTVKLRKFQPILTC